MCPPKVQGAHAGAPLQENGIKIKKIKSWLITETDNCFWMWVRCKERLKKLIADS